MTRLRRRTNQAKENHGTPIITSLFSTPSAINGSRWSLFDQLPAPAPPDARKRPIRRVRGTKLQHRNWGGKWRRHAGPQERKSPREQNLLGELFANSDGRI